MTSIVCKNCSHHFKGNFCPTCGQSASVEPIGVKYFLHDIPHSILHIDKGFAYTFKQLLLRPGKTLQEYLAGKRVKHFKPFAFVLIMSTICSLLIKGVEKLINYRLSVNHETYRLFSSKNIFGQYPSLLIFALIPILSLTTWLFFIKKKYNFWEHFLINTYLAAFVNIFLFVIKLYQYAKYALFEIIGVNFGFFMVLFMTYYGFTFGVLMQNKGSRISLTLMIFAMTVLLSLIYMTAFSLASIATPWWK